jgi:hypothetical protein
MNITSKIKDFLSYNSFNLLGFYTNPHACLNNGTEISNPLNVELILRDI